MKSRQDKSAGSEEVRDQDGIPQGAGGAVTPKTSQQGNGQGAHDYSKQGEPEKEMNIVRGTKHAVNKDRKAYKP